MRFWRSMAVGFGLGSTTLGLILPGCGSGLGEVTVQELSSTNPPLPIITAERLQHCFANHGGQLQPGRYNFNPIVEVDQNGFKRSVKTPDMPDTAPDFAACTRIALGDMAIPDGILDLRRREATATNEVTREQRSYMGNPAVVVVVVVGLSEIVLEAGAYTVLFGVTVKVLQKAAEDVAEEGWRAVCAAHYAACMMTSVSKKKGNHWRQTRCGICERSCSTHKVWPDQVGSWNDDGSCNYWQPGWGR